MNAERMTKACRDRRFSKKSAVNHYDSGTGPEGLEDRCARATRPTLQSHPSGPRASARGEPWPCCT